MEKAPRATVPPPAIPILDQASFARHTSSVYVVLYQSSDLLKTSCDIFLSIFTFKKAQKIYVSALDFEVGWGACRALRRFAMLAIENLINILYVQTKIQVILMILVLL